LDLRFKKGKSSAGVADHKMSFISTFVMKLFQAAAMLMSVKPIFRIYPLKKENRNPEYTG
jgi:hypothetical protein